jgi:hypothetical protein
LVGLLFLWLRAHALSLAESYHDHWQLQNLSFSASIAIIFSCAILGLIGSWISVQYYLQAPEDI